MSRYVMGLHRRDGSYQEVWIEAESWQRAEAKLWDAVSGPDVSPTAYFVDVEILGTLEEGGDWRDEPVEWVAP